jgi:hypothetical protein
VKTQKSAGAALVVTVKPLKLETDSHPHLELVPSLPRETSEPIALRPSTRTRTPLTMAGVTAGLQLLLAARREARFSRRFDEVLD